MERKTPQHIKSLIDYYDAVVKSIDFEAKEAGVRAYGGVIRAGKGSLVENLAKRMILISWKELGKKPEKLSLKKETIKIPIREQYITRIRNPEVREFIRQHIKEYYYPLRTDIHVHVEGEFKIAIECKAYTENAMLKRILVDFTLFKQVYPNLAFVLFQLESQLGGDYSTSQNVQYGSPSTHTLLSYFDIDLNIITLLEGERKVDQPIHNPKYYKPLQEESIVKAIDVFKELLA